MIVDWIQRRTVLYFVYSCPLSVSLLSKGENNRKCLRWQESVVIITSTLFHHYLSTFHSLFVVVFPLSSSFFSNYRGFDGCEKSNENRAIHPTWELSSRSFNLLWFNFCNCCLSSSKLIETFSLRVSQSNSGGGQRSSNHYIEAGVELHIHLNGMTVYPS